MTKRCCAKEGARWRALHCRSESAGGILHKSGTLAGLSPLDLIQTVYITSLNNLGVATFYWLGWRTGGTPYENTIQTRTHLEFYVSTQYAENLYGAGT
jgi:hypothetical protein